MVTPRRSRRPAAAALALVVGIVVLLGPMGRPASAAEPLASADATFLSLLTTLRAARGLPALNLDPEASRVALAWSQTMARTGTLAHNDNLGNELTGWSRLGENVAWGYGVTPVFNALAASPGHLRNMVDGAFTTVGVGTVTDGAGRLWTTHVFLRPSGAAVPARPAPSPARPRASVPPTTRAPAPEARPRPVPTTTKAPPPTPATTAVPSTTSPPTLPEPTTTTSAILPQLPVVPTATTEATAPVPDLAPLVPVSSTTEEGSSLPVLAIAAMTGLLLLTSTGLLHRWTRPGRSKPRKR